jgi:ubiquinone/menaquinone biosynthesis C-methylase UbiE
MELNEAISLIQTIEISGDTPQTWADLGSGSGLFARALADMLAAKSQIYAIDKNLASFKLKSISNNVQIIPVQLDFVKDPLDLKSLDGILMANALHFVRDKKNFIDKTKIWFKNRRRFLIVEYDTDKPNPYVPYPLSFLTLRQLFKNAGFSSIFKITERPSFYNSGKIYSALITE